MGRWDTEAGHFSLSAEKSLSRVVSPVGLDLAETGPHPYYFFGLIALGNLAQVWAANPLSRSASYVSFIWSNDSPTGAPVELNTHWHSEHPKPSKFWLLIQTNLRGIAKS
jgi:hypothetical protein